MDSANGEITIVTKDGKTITLTIATDATVETEGTTSTLDTLEPGMSIEVSVEDDGEHATKILAHESKVHGTVVKIEDDTVTIETKDGTEVVVKVDDTTRIELDGDAAGSLSDIKVGDQVEVKFDPETEVAFKLELEHEKNEVEGWVQNIDGDQLTIKTENGDEITVTVGENAKIELADDSHGTLADIVDDLKIEVDYDPVSMAAFKIEIEHDEHDDDEHEDEEDEHEDDEHEHNEHEHEESEHDHDEAGVS